MIEKYSFGSITIDGKTYHHDVEIRDEEEILEWSRKSSHLFDVESVEKAVKLNPGVIILGTGAYGVAKVEEECRNFIEEKGIELIIEKTGKAIKTFNTLCQESKKRVIGLFHLTC